MNLNSQEIEDLYITLAKLEDPRDKRGIRYKYSDILLLLIYGILAGQQDATDVEDYITYHFEYFHKLIGLEHVPSHDTFSRTLRMTNFESLANTLSEWLETYYPQQIAFYQGRKVLHVDGKAVRAAARKSEGEKPVYLMNAVYEGGTISVFTDKVGDKENEIACIPKYLERFNLEDTIVTIDAIGCNKNIIDYITQHKGNFIVPVKENQKNLYNAIEREVKRLKETKEYDELDKAELSNKDHGRIEHYSSTMLSDTKFLYDEFKNKSFYGQIARIGIIEKDTEMKDDGHWKKTHTTTYVITDLENISMQNLLALKIAHWHIESNHYIMDVQLNEDRCTARRDNATINASILKRFCMRIKKQSSEFQSKTLKHMTMGCSIYPDKISKILFIDLTKKN